MPGVSQTCFIAAIICCCTKVHSQTLPKTLVKDARSGQQVAFDKIFKQGEVTLVSFWATWCIPGKREVKTIAKNMQDWKKQVAFSYAAVAVDQQHNAHLVLPYVLSQKWDFPVYIDAPSNLKKELNFNALPFIMIIDKEGKVVFTHTGFDDGGLIIAKLREAAARL